MTKVGDMAALLLGPLGAIVPFNASANSARRLRVEPAYFFRPTSLHRVWRLSGFTRKLLSSFWSYGRVLSAIWAILLTTLGNSAPAQTVTLYLEPKFYWHGWFSSEPYFSETPEQAFAAIDAYLRTTGQYGQNPRPGRTWESLGEVGGVWAFNQVFMPWAFDVMWGDGTFWYVGPITVGPRCPVGTTAAGGVDYTLVRNWYFCTLNVPVDSAPPSNTDSESSSTCNDPRSPEIGTPILALPGIKRKDDIDVPASVLSARHFYRSDTQRFEFASDSVAIRKITDPWMSPPSRDGPCMTLPHSWTGSPPYEFHCYPVVGYSSSELGSTATSVLLKSPGGRYREFNFAAPGVPTAELSREAWTLPGDGYRVLNRNTLQIMDAGGRLLSEVQPDGRNLSFVYSSPLPLANRSRLVAIQDSFGRTLQLDYNAQGLLSRVTRPDARTTEYFYDEPPFSCSGGTCGALTSVLYPDGHQRQYRYNEAGFVTSPGNRILLTGVVDELGNRIGTYRYDSQFRAYSTESADGVNRWTIDFSVVNERRITPPVGSPIVFQVANVLNLSLLAGTNQPAGSGCGPSSAAITYDAQANASSRTDFNNNKICYAYDLARNLETKRVEGLVASANCSTALTTPPSGARVITTEWHPYWRLPTRVAEPKKITTSVYNDTGATCAPATALVDGRPVAVVCSRTEQATTDESGAAGFSATVTGTPRTWRYTYTTYGRVLTATDPNNRTTTYSYHADDDPDIGKRGNVATITNAANHVTSITAYNPHGQLTRVVDPNGVVTVLTYDPRMRLTSHARGSEATVYRYDPRGLLEESTLPDGAVISYTHDAAHRLTAINDHKSNRIDYTLDAMGNRTAEQVRDPSGTLVTNIARVIDALNRVERITGLLHSQ